MATISTETVFLKGGGEWKKKITYSKGMFRIKLPEVMCQDMNIVGHATELSANSEFEVDSLFKGKMKEWEAAIEIRTKVILFRAKFQGALLKEEKWQYWSDGKYKPYSATNTNNSKAQGCWYFFEHDIDFNNCPDLGLMLVWGVYEKVDIKGRVKFNFVSGRDLLFGSWRSVDDATEIEWTEEREQFFLEIDETFARMIAKVYKALGDLTPEKLLALTDSGLKLLGNS